MKKRNLRKKVLALSCVLAIGMGTVACSEETVGAGSTFSGELEQNVTIRVLENDTAIERGYFKELVESFNAEYKDKGIVAVDANMDQYQDLETNGPLGFGPDILYQANDVLMKYVEGEHILPLPIEKLETAEHISAKSWQAYETVKDGTTYTCGVPVNEQAPLLYYRKDLLPLDWEQTWDDNQNDIPDMVETWNDMYRFSKFINDNDATKFGYMNSIVDLYFSSGFLFSYGGYVFGDNGRDTKDIGFSKGDAKIGAQVLLDLASVMNQECSSHDLKQTLYSKMAKGSIFATMTTPDMTTTFKNLLRAEYKVQNASLTDAELDAKVEENLVVTVAPMLPADGDITDGAETEFITTKMMGGVNGYAISSYTKAPNACLEFINFATSYEMLYKRAEMLGISPSRKDLAEDIGGISRLINTNFAEGNVSIMPSTRAIAQIWTPSETFLSDLASDPFRGADKKYDSLDKIQAGLEKVDENIYSAIHSLS